MCTNQELPSTTLSVYPSEMDRISIPFAIDVTCEDPYNYIGWYFLS